MATADGNRPYPERTPTHETSHDPAGDASLSETVIESVAAAAEVDPMDFDLELYQAVDLEALDTLYERRSRDGHWRFEFSIEEFVVVVEADGRITVWDGADGGEQPRRGGRN